MDVEGWLAELGLKRLAALFRAQDIGLDVLPELTEADLGALGISLGDRKRLLRALSAMHSPHMARAAAPPRQNPERRQLTVVFVDLVGSTSLSTRLDPEELRDVIQHYQTTVATEVARFDGHVAKYMGDGVLAYFGWPTAQEHGAEGAVRAGLAAADAVARLDLPHAGPLAARVGIATGLVVVGDLIGEGAAQEEAVVGETPNLAARLQALAPPGTVVVAAATRRLLGGLFELAELGSREVRGFAEPIVAFRVVAARDTGNRFEALHRQRLVPLVGREDQVGLLLDRWRSARGGAGQVVLLVGEAGIGKSRLLQHLCGHLSSERHMRLRLFCSPFHQNTAFYPILDHIQRAARLNRNDTVTAKLGKLERLFTANAAALIATILGLTDEASEPASSLAPQARKAKLQAMLLQQLEALAASNPVLMLLEDLHWIDASSRELFDLVIERIQGLPVLLVITARPGTDHPWLHHPHVTEMTVERFGPRESAALIGRTSSGRSVPAAVLDQLVARADGVPLFLEELARAYAEGDLLCGALDPRPQGAATAAPIPATLQDLLMARLDRLASVKPVAQTAAAIGRDFPYDLLSVVSGLSRNALENALTQLCAADLIHRSSDRSQAVYSFRHALVRDAAYASLLRSPRRSIHARIAAALRERPDGAPEVIAHHLTEAGEADASVAFWEQAGRRAVSRAASVEAVAHFRQALAQLLSLEDSAERRRREAKLQSALGAVLVHVTGPASKELGAAYLRARDLYGETGDGKARFTAEWNLWHVYFARAEYAAGNALAKKLMSEAESGQDSDLVLQACHVEWVAFGNTSDYGAALASCERGWALYDPDRHGAHAFTFGGHDPGVCSRNQAAAAHWVLGQPDRARACHEQALALARHLDHPLILVNALARGLPLLQRLRDRDRLEAQADATIALATEQGFPNYRIDAEILRAWARRRLAAPGETTRLIQAGLAERRRLSSMWLNPYFMSLLASAQAQDGALDAALTTIVQALDECRATGDVWLVPDLVHTKGEILRQAHDIAAAEDCFATAVAWARTSSARMRELRSATSLAKLRAAQGLRAAARQVLAPIYQQFDEGLGTPDLEDARVLLAALANS